MSDFDMEEREAEIELRANPANPGLRRYDGRAVGQAVRGQRTRERELRRIHRVWDKIAASLVDKEDIQSKRLLYEITKSKLERLEGKPFVAVNPHAGKRGGTMVDARLQLAIQNLVMGPPAPQLPPKVVEDQVVAAPVTQPQS